MLDDRRDLAGDHLQRWRVAAGGIGLVEHQRLLVRILLLADVELVAGGAAGGAKFGEQKIGRASCRERV